MANLRPQNSQRTESLFAKNHEPFFNGIDQKQTSEHCDFAFGAAIVAAVSRIVLLKVLKVVG
jgi:hypothetical protein